MENREELVVKKKMVANNEAAVKRRESREAEDSAGADVFLKPLRILGGMCRNIPGKNFDCDNSKSYAGVSSRDSYLPI